MEKPGKPIKNRKPLIISLVVVSLIIIAVIITLCVVLTKKDSDKKQTIRNVPSDEPSDKPSEEPSEKPSDDPSDNQTGVMVNNPIIFDFPNKRVKLNSGYYMPTSGIGTYLLSGQTCYNSVSSALKSGVRLIDSAYIYGNEEQVGRAVRDSGISRNEIFVTTKMFTTQFSNPENAIETSLSRLNIEYIDLMLLHHPGNNDVKAYLAMEKYVESGKIKSIGLSNFYIDELKRFLPQINIMPSIIQNEIHPYYQETNIINYVYDDIRDKGIIMEAWFPLGGKGHNTELLNDQVLKTIGNKYNKSIPQVILRWDLQRGTIVIPGSTNSAHIQEDFDIYDFELTTDDMRTIANLNKDLSHNW